MPWAEDMICVKALGRKVWLINAKLLHSFIHSFTDSADLDKIPVTFIASTLLNAAEVLMMAMEMMTIMNT